MDLSDIEIAFDYGSGEDAELREIARNVQTILTTPIGTCPLYRDFGIKMTFLDAPLEAAQNLFAVEVVEAVEKWEPRVIVKEVTYQASGDAGQMKAKVVLING